MSAKVICSLDLGVGEIKQVLLPRPSTGDLSAFLIKKKATELAFFDLQCINNAFASWFIGDFVVKDGNIYLAVPFDPVFVLLSLLTEVCPLQENEFPFVSLEQMLTHPDIPDLSCLQNPLIIEKFSLLCNTKSIANGAITVFQLDISKVLKSLEVKVEATYMSLNDLPKLSHKLGLSNTSTSDERRIAALRVLTDYLHPFWLDKLILSFNLVSQWNLLKAPIRNHIRNPNDFSRISTDSSCDVTPLEDYSMGGGNIFTPKPKTGKVATIDKKIKEKDIRGVNKLTSFFGAK